MSIKHIFLVVALIASIKAINANSVQTIDVLNNSAQVLHISANNLDHSLCLKQVIPCFSKSLIVVQVAKLKYSQDLLFQGIFNDSPEEIRQAIRAGASVNFEKEGKRPLLWAVLLQRSNSARCLLEYGAF